MQVETVSAFSLVNHARLDSKYFLSPGIQAADRIAQAKARGVPSVQLGGEGGIARIWQPKRFKRAYAAPSEKHLPYLRPYDVFEYLPEPADLLSVKRNKNIENYILKRGMLLQSCSGRNLGPAVFVDSYLAKFVVGDDLIRIEIDDDHLRAYVLAFLQSETGQQLLTQGKTGSVIDHVSKTHVEQLEIPLLEPNIRAKIASKMGKAIRLREEARLAISNTLSEFEQSLPKIIRKTPEKMGWTVNAKSLTDRLDAASYDPLVMNTRKRLAAMGGVRVDAVASVIKPTGRYKTYYVDSAHGKPILSGTQLLQARPINLRHIAARAFKNPDQYKLRKGWIAYQADGRAEEGLGLPVMITSDRAGWLASGHVGRVVNNKGVDSGGLYIALRSQAAQIQIKSLASGSVVDSTFPWDMESVILPPNNLNGKIIQRMWENFAKAQEAENEAISLIENALRDTNSENAEIDVIKPQNILISDLEEGYEVLKPIPISVSQEEGFVAKFDDANINTSGDTWDEAVSNMRSLLLDMFDLLLMHEVGALGVEPRNQLSVLRSFIKKTEYAN
jgi:predicted RNase H-like HicB family nuclease